MNRFKNIFLRLLASVASFLVMIIMAILSFYITVFVVSAGAGFAGYDPSADFVVLSAALLVVSAIIAGGLSPIVFLSEAFGGGRSSAQRSQNHGEDRDSQPTGG